MSDKYGKTEIHVWTPLIGFDKDDDDSGAARFLARMPFVPDGVSAFLFHMDVIMQHEGMEQERVLPPDCCSYNASPRNGIRQRQEWTNHDLRTMLSGLRESGVETYLSIMADVTENRFHKEWIYDHPEIVYDAREEKGAYNVLRRLRDGSYFEDFFIEKLCQTLTDYGFAGFLPTDLFCPMCLRISMGDYSSDMLQQFVSHTGISLTDELKAGLGDDSNEQKCLRGDWLWNEKRAEWIRFYAWRWGVFWKKLCKAVHAIGKKVMSLGVYCTDPFENLYCMGLDLRILAANGIDGFMPNIVPTGMRLQHPDWRDPFHNYMNLLPLLSAFVPNTKLLTMLGVRDDTEEWDILHHAPCNLERDIYMLENYMRVTPQGLKRCGDGFMVCLGDSLRHEDWLWLKERFDVALYENPKRALTPILVWSDAGFDNMLSAYIQTRRFTVHKYITELGRRGTLLNTVVRIEDLDAAQGVLFVPNFDLLPPEEQKRIAAYDGAVVCTAWGDFNPAAYGFEADICFSDIHAPQPACVFSSGLKLSAETKAAIEAELAGNNGRTLRGCDPDTAEEYAFTVLRETIPFAKVSEGFLNALALLLRSTGFERFTCNLPITVMKLSDGRYRVQILNPSLTSYGYAILSAAQPMQSVEIVSCFPQLPLQYVASPRKKIDVIVSNRDQKTDRQHVRVKVTPGGMTILEVLI